MDIRLFGEDALDDLLFCERLTRALDKHTKYRILAFREWDRRAMQHELLGDTVQDQRAASEPWVIAPPGAAHQRVQSCFKLCQGKGFGQEVVRARIERADTLDRKSTRLNSSHQIISYAVFCLKKKT